MSQRTEDSSNVTWEQEYNESNVYRVFLDTFPQYDNNTGIQITINLHNYAGDIMTYKKTCYTLILAGIMNISFSASADLFFSEYIEGSSYNKAVEIYNPSSEDIDLSSYSINLYSNGRSIANSTFPLSGIIEAHSVFVIAHPKADPIVLRQATITSGTINFNGNDAISLTKKGQPVDVIGQIGFNPGSEWGNKEVSTKNHTIRRKPFVMTGNTQEHSAFHPEIEWDGFDINTFDGLGWY